MLGVQAPVMILSQEPEERSKVRFRSRVPRAHTLVSPTSLTHITTQPPEGGAAGHPGRAPERALRTQLWIRDGRTVRALRVPRSADARGDGERDKRERSHEAASVHVLGILSKIERIIYGCLHSNGRSNGNFDVRTSLKKKQCARF